MPDVVGRVARGVDPVGSGLTSASASSPMSAGTSPEFRHIGRSGLVVSVAGLGCNNFGSRLGPEESAEVVRAALDSGITLFDTADSYGGPGKRGLSEQYLGDALRGRRDGVVIATKFGMTMGGEDGALPQHEAMGSRRYIRKAVENSLRRLETDRIDLLQLHQPDPRTPIDETLHALDDLVRAGKVLYVGAGGRQMGAWQFVDAWWTATNRGHVPYVAAQVEWSLVERKNERDIIPACEHLGISVLPFFPLGSGLLTGKYRAGQPPTGSRLAEPAYRQLLDGPQRAVADRLAECADEVGVSLLELALGWLASRPAVGSVISGARTPDQVRANAAAVAWRPSADVLARIEEITDSAGTHER